MDNALVREFPPQTLDKVERLLDLLEELGEHPRLRGRLALHGGTAINLFLLDVPRLSVDRHLVRGSPRQGGDALRKARHREVHRGGRQIARVLGLGWQGWPCGEDVPARLPLSLGCRPRED
ncbi:MAG: nucleotidyl transferase AbiEii/AbiGii toxin family protein [Olsenella sp.]|nr:nucleotidyl transferase AbiEii/AbiGii toxin family protein [Olsenella sp.]